MRQEGVTEVIKLGIAFSGKNCKNLDGIKTGEDKTGGSKMKKVNNGKDMAVRSRPVWMGAAVWYHIELAGVLLSAG